MAKLLGTKDERRHDIDVSLLTRGAAEMLPAFDALALVMPALAAHVEREGLGRPRLGHMVSNQVQAEAGLYIDHSFIEGAVVGARCPLVATRVELTVARSSTALRSVVWGSLAVGLLGGLATSGWMLPDSDARLVLAAGLGIGLVAALVVMAAAIRIEALAGGRSFETAAALDAAVQSWIATLSREPPARKTKSKRKREPKPETEASQG